MSDDVQPPQQEKPCQAETGIRDEIRGLKRHIKRIIQRQTEHARDLVKMSHKLYGNGEPGLFEQVRNHEEQLQNIKAGRNEFRAWAVGIIGTVIGAAIIFYMKMG